MNGLDQSRLLILSGYVIARLADLQFERASFVFLAGLAIMVVFHLWLDPWMRRKAEEKPK
jgi:hypothetical protein